MIGVLGNDRCSAEQLFGQHSASHQMWPCRFAKGDKLVSARPLDIAKAVGSANQEARFAYAVIAPTLEQSRQFHRTEQLAFFIQDDRFVRTIGNGQFAAPVGQLAELCRPAYSLHIAFDQFSFRRLADFATRDDMQAHRHQKILEAEPSSLRTPRWHFFAMAKKPRQYPRMCEADERRKSNVGSFT